MPSHQQVPLSFALMLLLGSICIFAAPQFSVLEPNLTTMEALPAVICFQAAFLLLMFAFVLPGKPQVYFAGRAIVSWLLGSFAFHFIAVMFGAPFVDKAARTLLWSCLMSALTFLPTSCLFGSDVDTWQRILRLDRPRNSMEIACLLPAVGCIAGAWIGAFPIPLDWDRPWQVWPTSCVIGSEIGYSVGLLCASFALAFGKQGGNKVAVQ